MIQQFQVQLPRDRGFWKKLIPVTAHILLIVVLLSKHAFSQQPVELSLKQAQAYALQHSYTHQVAQFDLVRAQKKVKETTAIGLPQINAEVSYQNFIRQPVQVVPAEFFGGEPGEFAEVIFNTKQNATAQITGTQLIFNGSYIIGLQAARSYVEFSEKGVEKSELELKDAVAQAYNTAMVADENVDILEKSRDNLKKTVAETKALYENGFVEEQDFEQLSLTYSDVENALENATRQQAIVLDLLKFQIGMSVDTPIVLTDKLQAAVETSEQTAVKDSFELGQNIDVQIAEKGVELSMLNLRNKKSAYLPSLSGFLNHQQNAFRNEFSFLDSDQDWFPTTLLGINLSIPIFSSFMKRNIVQQASLDLEKAKVQREQAIQGVKLEIERAKSDYLYAMKNYKIQSDNLALAERINNKTRKKYGEGISSSFELNQSETQLLSSQGKYIESMLQLLNAKSRLDKVLNNY